MLREFWPSGDDPHSRNARGKTRVAFAWTVLICSGVYLLVRIISC